MLFKHAFHPGIRDGSITQTFRDWKSPQVKVGGTYRLSTGGFLEVTAVDEVELGSITRAHARKAGFDDPEELVAGLKKWAKRKLTARSKVYRVRFRFADLPDPREEKRADTSAAALDDVATRLGRMDARSARGPWTREVLELIAAKPEVSAAVLAPELGRERLPFKADVRKLKALALTISHKVGYRLSPRGEALLKKRSW